MKDNGNEYRHGGSAGKNLKLLFISLAASVLHLALWGGLILGFRTDSWFFAVSAVAAAGQLFLLVAARTADRRDDRRNL